MREAASPTHFVEQRRLSKPSNPIDKDRSRVRPGKRLLQRGELLFSADKSRPTYGFPVIPLVRVKKLVAQYLLQRLVGSEDDFLSIDAVNKLASRRFAFDFDS